MPDKPIEPGSITQTADSQNTRISEVSSVSNTVNQMQAEVDQRLTEVEQMAGDSEGIAEVQNATIGVLHKMKETMGSFAQGISSITLGTATATKDAISQYGKAISEDISYNKQNIVAMALSRSTPLFGYFAAKFMETDVFQKGKEKMAESLKSVFSGIGKTIGGFFKGRKKGEEDGDIPKMQKGGYVKKGGMVEVHAGEIVAPIEKVLSRIDESVGAVQEIGVAFKRAQLHQMANMAGYVKGQEKLEKVGIFKGFLRAMHQVQTQYEEPQQMRMLRAVLSIQDTLGATIGTWEQVWTKMLIEHPTFRQIMFGLKTISTGLSLPGRIAYSVFKARGGYKSHLPNSKNPYENMSIILGMLYAESMHRLDNIVLNTRHTAWATRDLSTFITGKKYPPLLGIQKTFWSIMGIARKALNLGAKFVPPLIAGGIDLMLGGSGKAGWGKGKTLGDFLSKERKMWGTDLINKILEATEGAKINKSLYGELPGGGDIQKQLTEGTDKAPTPVRIVEYAKEAKKIEDKKWRDEQQSSGSLLSGVNNLYAANVKQHKKEQKTQKGIAKDLDQMNKRGKMKRIWDLIMGAFSGIGSIISTIVGTIGTVLAGLGLNKAWLANFLSPAAFKNFLGPAMGFAIGYGIGTLIDKYISGPQRKKWIAHFDKLIAEAESTHRKKMKVTEDKLGAVKGQVKDKALISETEKIIMAQQISQTAGGAGKAGEARKSQLGKAGVHASQLVAAAQREYQAKNWDIYSMYDPNEIAAMRNQWIIEDKSVPHFSRKKWSFFGKQIDEGEVHDYGTRREMQFLRYLQEHGNKRKVPESVVGTTATDLKNKAKVVWSRGKEKATEIKDKVETAVKETSEIAKDYAKDAEAKSKKTIEALEENAKNTLDATKEMSKNISESVGTQVTNLSNTVSDSSQKIATSGGQAANNLYQDLKRTVITGKVDSSYLDLEMF